MKKIRWIFLFFAAIGVGSALFIKGASADSGADNQALIEKKEALCPKVIHLEEKYKEDFWKEDGHRFCVACCKKEAVSELATLLEYQQELNYSEKEIASTFKKLSHCCYGINIFRGNLDVEGSFSKAKDFAKEAIRLDPNINDCLTLALADVKERKEHAGCKGGVCTPKSAERGVK